ncbi:MAG: SUMF1/EgtB/PvdO family nonheme iron enzyme [Planctomycetaceae bacterium]|jgi:formylglycine-generating enzyme required for sulfatase activity|nr:SUMF1/EgtB/PvdO family nonheme iron enzyme [Planctomycetaceae bacterium]
MSRKISFALLIAAIALISSTSFAQTERNIKNYGSGQGFAQFAQKIKSNHDVNLLTFPGAKLVKADKISDPKELTDGKTGDFGGNGRVVVSGSPSTVVYYLGKPRTIQEISVFSANGDQRSNQDFEIRLANNATKPGQAPQFPKEATLTSGDVILGANGGAFETFFAEKSGKPILEGQKFDWIELKIWQTYNVNAGTPAKSQNAARGWSSYIELQAIGDLNDPELFASEQEKKNWLYGRAKAAFDEKLKTLGHDAFFALEHRDAVPRFLADMEKKYPDAIDTKAETARWTQLSEKVNDAIRNADVFNEESVNQTLNVVKEYETYRRELLLKNPLIRFEKLLVRRAQNAGLTANWVSNCQRGKGGYGNALGTVNPIDPNSPFNAIIENPNGSFVGDVCLNWDAKRALVTALSNDKTWQIHELNLADGQLRQVTPSIAQDVDNTEGIYMPDGGVTFISTASMMGVPCVGGSDVVGNIYRLEPDGKTIRQLTFEQDQDWCPTMLHNGRIMYLRWEYVDLAHYFTRILFSMNPDGTNQMEHYGSGSFWPNSLFYAKAVEGHKTKFVGVVSGHHGTARAGELVVFDPVKGRREADGALQHIPGYGKPVEPIIADQLVDRSWPKFLFPVSLDENYYVVSCKMTPESPWAIYLVDTWDNMLKIREEPDYGLFEPTPVLKREQPPVIASRLDPTSDQASVFITDIYEGPGLRNVPRGTVKKLRVFAYSYGYRGIGGHDVFGLESCWDGRRILGEAPVFEDGSAVFSIPANTPIAIQPLDEQGRSLQLMRSWFVGMPGEKVSCVGCHEQQNSVTPPKMTMASQSPVQRLKPYFGKERPFSFEGEIQPVLSRYCVGCHDGTDKNIPNFADTNKSFDLFSNAYHALAAYVRRPGPESDVYMFQPLEYHTSTSELFQILEKGHYNVELDRKSWELLHCWADLNVPYFGTWTEIADARKNKDQQENVAKMASRHNELKMLYADRNLDFETGAYTGYGEHKNVSFVKPNELLKPNFSAPMIPNWPLTRQQAIELQKQGVSSVEKSVAVDNEHSVNLVRIPAGTFIMGDENGALDELPRRPVTIQKPFWMTTTEVTNSLYKLYAPTHDSRFVDQWWKDHTTPGYPANKPNQPVIRVNWQEANDFCKWLSEKTGKTFRLPTEAEWEWACRAGTDQPMWYGALDADFSKLENMADHSVHLFVVAGVNPQPVGHQPYRAFIPHIENVNDGNMIAQDVGAYAPNAWGLYDMHGSVAEWTLSDYKAYPYVANDGRNAAHPSSMKTARGGSWNDRPYRSRAGFRLNYAPWQKVHNVGFRVIMEEK